MKKFLWLLCVVILLSCSKTSIAQSEEVHFYYNLYITLQPTRQLLPQGFMWTKLITNKYLKTSDNKFIIVKQKIRYKLVFNWNEKYFYTRREQCSKFII